MFDYESIARTKMNSAHWDFLAGGSDDEVTLRSNRAALERIRLRPRVLVDVRANTLMIASTTAIRSLEEIAKVASGPLWFHLYVYPSLEFAEKLVHRAESAGYRAIVLTVDLPTLGNREKDRRNNVVIPPPPFFEANFLGVEKSGQEWVSLTWESLSWLRSITSLPILLKGILTADGAKFTSMEEYVAVLMY